MNFSGVGNTVFFEPKSWWKHIYLLLESSCFELFGNGKYGLFLRQKVNEKMIFTDYWNVLVLNFSGMKSTAFFEAKSWWKDDIYWLLESSCFEPWKVLVLNFSEMGNTVIFWGKKLIERWCLLGLFELSKIFQYLGNMVFHAV